MTNFSDCPTVSILLGQSRYGSHSPESCRSFVMSRFFIKGWGKCVLRLIIVVRVHHLEKSIIVTTEGVREGEFLNITVVVEWSTSV